MVRPVTVPLVAPQYEHTLILMGLGAVPASLVAPQYEHTLRLLGSVLFRSFAGSLPYDSHVEGNAHPCLSSRWIILRHSKTCQARLDLDVVKHRKRECHEDRFWRIRRDYGTMARANDSKRFQSITSLTCDLAHGFTSATNKQVQATYDKLAKRVIQTSV